MMVLTAERFYNHCVVFETNNSAQVRVRGEGNLPMILVLVANDRGVGNIQMSLNPPPGGGGGGGGGDLAVARSLDQLSFFVIMCAVSCCLRVNITTCSVPTRRGVVASLHQLLRPHRCMLYTMQLQ